MIISDLGYLEVVTEANSVEGGCGEESGYKSWYGDYKINSANNYQSSCGNSSYAAGGLGAFSGGNGNNISFPVQGNNVQGSLLGNILVQ